MGARVMPLVCSRSRVHRDFRSGRRLMVMSPVAPAWTSQAAEPSVVWNTHPECAETRQEMAVAAEVTGQAPLVIPSDRHIRGVVEPSGPGWQLSLTLFDGSSERSRVLTAPSCSELARAAGVALALALDPHAAGEL